LCGKEGDQKRNRTSLAFAHIKEAIESSGTCSPVVVPLWALSRVSYSG